MRKAGETILFIFLEWVAWWIMSHIPVLGLWFGGVGVFLYLKYSLNRSKCSSIVVGLLIVAVASQIYYSQELTTIQNKKTNICKEIEMMKFTITSYLARDFWDFTADEFKEYEKKVNNDITNYAKWFKDNLGHGTFADFSYWEDKSFVNPDIQYSGRGIFKVKLQGIRENLIQIERKQCP